MADLPIFKPETAQQGVEIIRQAYEKNEGGFIIQGGATKSNFGPRIDAQAQLSSLALCAIETYNPGEMVLTAGAGTPLDDIETVLSENKQRLVFEPMDHRPLLGTMGQRTIGAVAAGNISGPRRFVSGAARDSLLGVEFINGRGNIIKNGGQVMKNVTGLDLVKLMAGSWGTLGFLTKVTFKVVPTPQSSMALVLHGLDDQGAIDAMAHVMASSLEVNGAAHLPEGIGVKIMNGNVAKGSATIFRLEGFEKSVQIRAQKLVDTLSTLGTLSRLEGDEASQTWREIRDCIPFASEHQKPLWRVSVKPSMAAKYVMALRMKAGVMAYYDWQGGLIWLQMEGECEAQSVRSLLAQHGGGHATLMRADDSIRNAERVFHPQSAPIETLQQRIKAQLDPRDLFNSGFMSA